MTFTATELLALRLRMKPTPSFSGVPFTMDLQAEFTYMTG